MGAAVSGHSCGDHGGRLKRVDCNDVSIGACCAVCRDPIMVGVRVHRCREVGCPYVLHDGCFHLPVKFKCHFAHPQHRLALGAAAAAGSCGLCAERLEPHTYQYTCVEQGCGFRMHPRCCNLPNSMYDTELHKDGRLVLRSPWDGNGNNGARRCLKCNKQRTTSARTTAWSYRCPQLECNGTEMCLKCVLGNGNDTGCICGCCDVDPGRLGVWIGDLFCGIGYGMGFPCFRAPLASTRN